jgi:MFS family permease
LRTTTINIKTPGKSTRVAIYAALITFLTYATVYGFRKGFTVCTFDGMSFAGIDYKIWLVISQVLGYTLSKFYGIRFIAELKRSGRGRSILLLTAISWIALLLFAIVPAPWNIIFLFINGFPLGMIWGIVFSFVEGRKATDFIGAALSVSFIFSSGFVKTVAEWLKISFHLSEFWVPFVTGFVFGIPLVLFVFLLEKIPPPSEEDIQLRTTRLPMTKEKRREFVHMFLPGLVTAVTIYVFSTIFRDIRDNFIADMWKEMGYVNQPALFTETEMPTTIIVLVLISSMILIKNNFKALITSHIIIAIGFTIAGISTFEFMQQGISPTAWMTLVGLGLYMTYIPFNCVFFERMIATFKIAGNVGFLIYIADSFGYLGSVSVLLGKELFHIRLLWVPFYTQGVIILSLLGVAGTFASMIYFSSRYKKNVSTAWINVPQS